MSTPPIPSSALGLALASLVGQVFLLVDRGRGDNDLVISMVLGAAVIGWVSYGVLRARGVRVVLVWIAFVLGMIAEGASAFGDGNGGDLLHLATTITAFVFFVRFTGSPYYQWQKTRPVEPGPSLAPLVAIAIAVGALGGVVGAQDSGFHAEVNL